MPDAPTATPTMAELQQQRLALESQIVEASIAPLQDALAVLNSAPVADASAALLAVMGELPPGEALKQIGNVLTVLTTVPVVLANELAAAQTAVNGGNPLPSFLPMP